MGSSPHEPIVRASGSPQTRLLRLANESEPAYNCAVKSTLRVASPPVDPLVIYDGDCTFCCFWIRRWQHATGNQVAYLPLQDPGLAARFPELPRERLETALHFIENDGAIFSAAEAAFRALAHNPKKQWLLNWYE